MYKFLRNLSCLLCLILVFGGCRKKAFDAYYGKPSTLEPPIYQVLQKRGNFTNLLKIIDKSGYKTTLGAAGFWTFFAPNDAAFNTYFTNNPNGITSIDKISDSLARAMVTYCLVYNAFTTDHLADYQSPTGYLPGIAFRRRTAYYDGFQYLHGKTLATITAADSVYVFENRDAIQPPNTTYVYGDNNNKYIPYFYSSYMDGKGLTAADYNYFFPNTPYTGFNVVNASVVNKDIIAENGVIHEIDHVITPLRNIEQILSAESDYSVFKSVFDQFLVSYNADISYTRQFNTVTNKTNTVYVKNYPATLPYALGNESYIKFEDNDSQREGYTLFAPKNAPFKHYLNSVIFKYYHLVAPVLDTVTDADMRANLQRLPPSIITDLMGSHMYQAVVYPSKFSTTQNLLRETPGIDPNSNVVAYKEFGSNGAFYGINDVHRANVFSTVFARLYLDPAYSIALKLITSDAGLKTTLTSPGVRYTLFAISDAAYATLGYTYDPVANSYSLTVNGTKTTTSGIQDQMKRLLQLSIVPTPNNELNNLTGDGITETNNGEYIRWHNNTVSSGGAVEQNKIITIDSAHPFDDFSNGRVYYLANNGILPFASDALTLYASLLRNGTATTDPYYDFVQYLVNSTAFNPGTVEILGAQLGANYTIFVPTHAGIVKAINDGLLPGSAPGGVITAASYKPTTSADQLKVQQFIQYHILNGITIAPDGKKPGSNLVVNYPTFLKDETGKAIPLGVYNAPDVIVNGVVNGFRLQDAGGNPAVTLVAPNNNSYFPATSNYLGNRVLIHQINGYLSYKKVN